VPTRVTRPGQGNSYPRHLSALLCTSAAVFQSGAPGERIVGPDCWLETKTTQVIVTKRVTSLFPEKSVSLSYAVMLPRAHSTAISADLLLTRGPNCASWDQELEWEHVTARRLARRGELWNAARAFHATRSMPARRAPAHSVTAAERLSLAAQERVPIRLSRRFAFSIERIKRRLRAISPR